MLSNDSLIFTRFFLPVLDDFTDKDNENIERIYKNVLMTTKSRAQQKALVKKYLGWVSRQPKKKVELFFFFFFFPVFISFFFFFWLQCCFGQLRKKSEGLEHGIEGMTYRIKVGKIREKSDIFLNKDC